jgi:transketolase
MSTSTASIQTQAINTIRTLSMDGVQAANSGHPGTPMALAPVTYCIWNDHLRYDPQHPQWPARDRFVLSCGHASMLLYSILHLAGVSQVDAEGNPTGKPGLTLDNLKNFRQMNSPCAGHPEYGDAPGIETTTGPLGQGVGNSVGMAIAAKWYAARYNKPGYELFDYDTFALCSDGDLMEGVSCEAASLAGHLKLSNLCWIYDDNNITIEGDTDLAFTEDVAKRFQGLGWNTLKVNDANDLAAINKALAEFKKTNDRPTLVVLKSIIAWGSPNKQNTHGAHGAPLGEKEISLTKAAYGWPDEKFLVPEEVRQHFAEGFAQRGADDYQSWQEKFAAYKKEYPALAAELEMIWSRKLPKDWDASVPEFPADAKGMATRISSGKVLNGVAKSIPWFIGGSADLAPSTKTLNESADAGDFSPENYAGKNFHFGIREHGMAAACNGMALSGLRPYGATFFVFTDYCRPSLRLSSIMHQGVTYVMTHDSIGLGEDGPTHQPVEHLSACRAIPGVIVMRPGDANEVAYAYRAAMEHQNRPTIMVCTRQDVPTLDRTKFGSAEGVLRGGYILAETGKGAPDLIVMSTGSEVSICVQAWDQLAKLGKNIRLVSMPSLELFAEQDEKYRESVLPKSCTKRIAVEAGIQQCWDKYLGWDGHFIGMKSFGASAPFEQLYERFGITADAIVAAAKKLI